MAPVDATKAADQRDAEGDPRNEMHGGSLNLNSQNPSRDQRLLSFDFIIELGHRLAVAAMAVCAAAGAENVEALEMALRHVRSILRDTIAEFRVIAPRSDRFAAAAREYHETRGGRR